ncbi:MAG: RsmE family RNA methyltransferase [Vulcanimicrobiaceae bacterium]
MRRTRFFAEGIHRSGERIELAAGDAHALRVVLRARGGEALEIVDSAGRAFDARVAFDGSRTFAELLGERAPAALPRLELVLAQALPKGDKLDLVVAKTTELGVTEIVPFACERSLARVSAAKLERWRRIARSAARQCGLARIPAVAEPASFEALVARIAASERVLLPWELAETAPLRERLPVLLEGVRQVLIAIGPEGGFEAREVERACAAGAVAISLGTRILRTETAGLVLCAALRYASGDL